MVFNCMALCQTAVEYQLLFTWPSIQNEQFENMHATGHHPEVISQSYTDHEVVTPCAYVRYGWLHDLNSSSSTTMYFLHASHVSTARDYSPDDTIA